jgi:transposase-like protein
MSAELFQTVPSGENDILDDLEGLDSGQKRAINALLGTTSISAAARQAGVGRTTLHRWLKEPTFARILREMHRLAVRQASALIQNSAGHAVATLTNVMDAEAASAASKVSASRTLLSLIYRVLEIEEISDRLTALEGARFESPPRRPVE